MDIKSLLCQYTILNQPNQTTNQPMKTINQLSLFQLILKNLNSFSAAFPL